MARTSTPERWNSALARGLATGVTPRRFGRSGWFLVPSATRKGLAYLTDGKTCSCEAARQGDPVCWHRSIVWPQLMASFVSTLDGLGWNATPDAILSGVAGLAWLEAHGVRMPTPATLIEPETAA